jgi:lipoprotein NlpI
MRRIFTLVFCGSLVAPLSAGGAAQPPRGSDNPRAVLARAVADFEQGRIDESVAGFDAVVRLVPEAMPELWQRGIALYYAGRYRECREQFEAHRLVNPADVENAAWHFLCVARAGSAEQARAALLPVGRDPRVPMAEIYRMFEGAIAPDSVLAAGRSDLRAQFYARLYVGLYYEATGDPRRAAEQLKLAADRRFAGAGGYMHTVAKVHVARLPPAPSR